MNCIELPEIQMYNVQYLYLYYGHGSDVCIFFIYA